MASGNLELEGFVREALLRGQSRDAIRAALAAAGWQEAQTRGVLEAYADVDFPVPVPRPRASLSARDAFLYLVLFSTLYTVAIGLGSLLFDLVNAALPDPAEVAMGSAPRLADTSMRWSVSALLIAFPVFAWLSRLLARELQAFPAKRFAPVRRWLTYLTLFVASGALICDMTALVYNVLGGELGLRFLLKVLVVALIAGTVFGYYLQDLRRDESDIVAGRHREWGRALLCGAAVVILAAVAGAIVLTGTPTRQREAAVDRHRVADLQRIEWAVDRYRREQGGLPPDLATVATTPGYAIERGDPVTGRPYGYRRIDAGAYELCADFGTDSRRAGSGPGDDGWAHGVGPTCFRRRPE